MAGSGQGKVGQNSPDLDPAGDARVIRVPDTPDSSAGPSHLIARGE